MELNEKGLRDRDWWKARGYRLPEFDREAVAAATKKAPFWIHFGAGNIFRAFPARAVQEMLDRGALSKGILAAEGYDPELLERIGKPHDEYSVLVTLKADGTVEKTVVGSVAASMEVRETEKFFTMDSLQIVSFTITEKGYHVPEKAADFENGPDRAESFLGQAAALLYRRFLSGKKPLAMVSMDNCSQNGDRLRTAMAAFAKEWAERGLADREFPAYVENKELVSFPWTMIDKITPRPDGKILEILKEDGLTGMEPVVTAKNSYGAPFVNAEECEYLVIEDAFPNGRPPLEEAGFFFTDRETVERAEKMKVCTCLNPLHTALAVFGCLLGYGTIAEEMKDRDLRHLLERTGYREGLPVAADPGIIRPEEFLDTVLNVRFPNPFLPDTPWRIVTDTSQKLPVRFGETIKAYLKAGESCKDRLYGIPMILAGWLRCLMGVDDQGREMELSPDPMAEEIRKRMAAVRLGRGPEGERLEELLFPVLSDPVVFGVDLYKAGLADRVLRYLERMASGPGMVRETLASLRKTEG